MLKLQEQQCLCLHLNRCCIMQTLQPPSTIQWVKVPHLLSHLSLKKWSKTAGPSPHKKTSLFSPQPTPPSKSVLSPLRPPNTKPFLGGNQYRNHSLPFNHCFFPSLTPFMVPLKVLAGQRRRPVTEETLAHWWSDRSCQNMILILFLAFF